ncbi:platelet-activating factor acetylhydrolase IB subunit [Paludisphaera mucosa]|uniref:Platelet-activating factor acetylhydrolase IB subunit n=1 Tax=Paludisphaera mucosa TaxID=3030827 RepID=A0ABT6F841_9BACT|nr:platelet-activating factor acetylhydrolase IB subunit [Paludisphaera mucosa]MDG3003758.1 platelet-activating factor acetylhydrolase IB subunit [Paludisphaera mucosa]
MYRKLSDAHRFVAVLAGAFLFAPAAAALAQAPPTATPSPRGDAWWKQRHETYLGEVKKAREAKGVDLLFLGDSITEGWGGNDVWKKHYAPRKALNLGIGGDQTQHVLWRIQNGEIDGIKPKAVMLMIGTNNSASSSADEIAAGVEAIVAELKTRLPESKILVLGVFPRGQKPDATRKKLQDVNARISKLDDGKKVFYLDIGKSFLEKDDTISKEIMPDYLHLSGKGYELWAEAVEPTLRKLLGEKP